MLSKPMKPLLVQFMKSLNVWKQNRNACLYWCARRDSNPEHISLALPGLWSFPVADAELVIPN